jgi:DNA polymerase-4
LRYEDFETHTKNLTLINPVLHSNDIYHYGCQLLKQFPLRKKVRLIGIGVSGLVTEEEGIQQSIFDMIEKKDEKIDHALKSIRDRFGEKSIVRAETLKIKRKHEK